MADIEKDKPQQADSNKQSVEPYEPPKLIRYGELDELTLGGNPALTNDPGGNSTGKFA